jgi:hypothetical protein
MDYAVSWGLAELTLCDMLRIAPQSAKIIDILEASGAINYPIGPGE